MKDSDISAKVRQSCFSDPFSLQPKQLQSDYVSSYKQLYIFASQLQTKSGDNSVNSLLRKPLTLKNLDVDWV